MKDSRPHTAAGTHSVVMLRRIPGTPLIFSVHPTGVSLTLGSNMWLTLKVSRQISPCDSWVAFTRKTHVAPDCLHRMWIFKGTFHYLHLHLEWPCSTFSNVETCQCLNLKQHWLLSSVLKSFNTSIVIRNNGKWSIIMNVSLSNCNSVLYVNVNDSLFWNQITSHVTSSSLKLIDVSSSSFLNLLCL